MSDAESLAKLIREGRRILAFTGAGISTGSGIPDFRGPQGVWTRRQPVYFDQFLAREEARVEYWDQKAEGWEAFRDARPNAAHQSLVTLEKRGSLSALVTQNIDGLHQQAGSTGVIELHGTNREVECLSCGTRTAPTPWVEEFRRTRACPRCSCGGLLKFATISFGQPLDQRQLRRAAEAAEDCDLVLALGSTLSVFPAAGVPLAAARRGVPYVIINRGPTDQDSLATLRIDGEVGEALSGAIAKL